MSSSPPSIVKIREPAPPRLSARASQQFRGLIFRGFPIDKHGAPRKVVVRRRNASPGKFKRRRALLRDKPQIGRDIVFREQHDRVDLGAGGDIIAGEPRVDVGEKLLASGHSRFTPVRK